MVSSITLRELYDQICKALIDYGSLSPVYEALWLIEHHLNFKHVDLILHPDAIIPSNKDKIIKLELQERLRGKPFSRIFGEREFWGLPFYLTPQTLDPRPDTETLVEVALGKIKNKKNPKVLDLGTGSGCILIAILSELPTAYGFGVDMSFDAIQTAWKNANRNKVSDRASFFSGNWLSAISSQFDLIVSNPPYIAEDIIPQLSKEVRYYDPILALSGGSDGLQAYNQIFLELKSRLIHDGTALFEIGFDQEFSVVRLAEKYGFSVQSVHQDLSGQPRVVEISCGDK